MNMNIKLLGQDKFCNSALYSNAKDAAFDIIRNYWDGLIPVDVVKISDLIGIDIFQTNDLDSNHIAHFGFKENDNKPTIILNISLNISSKRFAIAHCLGHYVLGHGSKYQEPRANFEMNNFKVAEREANIFAAHLLVPKNALDYFIEGNYGLVELAKEFNVADSVISSVLYLANKDL